MIQSICHEQYGIPPYPVFCTRRDFSLHYFISPFLFLRKAFYLKRKKRKRKPLLRIFSTERMTESLFLFFSETGKGKDMEQDHHPFLIFPFRKRAYKRGIGGSHYVFFSYLEGEKEKRRERQHPYAGIVFLFRSDRRRKKKRKRKQR